MNILVRDSRFKKRQSRIGVKGFLPPLIPGESLDLRLLNPD